MALLVDINGKPLTTGPLGKFLTKPEIVDPPDPADYTAYYDADPDSHMTLTGSDIDSQLDQGTAAINCTNVFGSDNTRDTSTKLDGYNTILGAASDDNWYRSAANASGILAEGAGMFVFAVRPTSIPSARVLWALENSAQGAITLFDDSGTYKVKVLLGQGGQQAIVNSTAVTLNTWNFVFVRYSGQDVYVQINNASEQSVSGTGGDVLATRLAQRYQILSNGGTQVMQGNAAVIAIRNTFPDATEKAAIKAAFKAKYASLSI